MASAKDTGLQAAYIQAGNTIDFTNDGEADIKAGAVLSMKYIAGVASCDIPKGKTGAVAITGIFEIPKKESEVLAIGDLVCCKDNQLQKHAEGDEPVGVAVSNSGAEEKTVKVALNL